MDPLNVLPPDLGMAFTVTPLTSDSADLPPTVTDISCTAPVLMTNSVRYPPPVSLRCVYDMPSNNSGMARRLLPWIERVVHDSPAEPPTSCPEPPPTALAWTPGTRTVRLWKVRAVGKPSMMSVVTDFFWVTFWVSTSGL